MIQTLSNDLSRREERWRRLPGDDWAAFDALPPAIRARLADHVYEAWSVNALTLWTHYRRIYGRNARAERALIRYLDYCERLERRDFARDYARTCGCLYPHDAACASILRNTVRSG